MLKNLKKLREERGISQLKLAEILSTSQQSINQYENRDIEPDIATLKAIALYFDTTIDYLVGNTLIKNKAIDDKRILCDEAEVRLINKYREFSPENRDVIDKLFSMLYNHQI